MYNPQTIKNMDFINSWQKGNKKAKYRMGLRLGRITVFELNFCACSDAKCSRFRIMLLNFGFEI